MSQLSYASMSNESLRKRAEGLRRQAQEIHEEIINNSGKRYLCLVDELKKRENGFILAAIETEEELERRNQENN